MSDLASPHDIEMLDVRRSAYAFMYLTVDNKFHRYTSNIAASCDETGNMQPRSKAFESELEGLTVSIPSNVNFSAKPLTPHACSRDSIPILVLPRPG